VVANDRDDNPDGFSPDAIFPGTLIDHYRIIERLGAGGMGEVYLAEDTQLGRRVALKFLPSSACQDAASRERLFGEARAASRLNHPNIVTIHTIGNFESRHFIVMEYIEGHSLRQIIAKGDTPIEDIVAIARQIGAALTAAHDAGIIHRDLKPENILIDNGGRVRICDFGLAHCRDVAAAETDTTSGSLAYMSPEQVQGDALDHRTDLFSLGVMLYELITGKLPFRGDYEASLIFAIVNSNPDPMSKYRLGLPDKLQEIVSRLLAKNREKRYPNAAAFVADLERLKGGVPGPPEAFRSKKKARFILPAITAIILIAAIAYLIIPREPAKKMLVVLPFENLGPAESDYLTQGVTDAITSALAKYGDLGVISGTSARQYHDTGKTIRQIADELNVDYVLEGSVHRDELGPAQRVNISCQLIKAGNEVILWTRKYEPADTQVIDIQDEIAQRVAWDISGSLPQRQLPERRLTHNPRAYDYYLQGNYYFHRSWGEADYRKAIQLYTNAVDLDSGFVMAYVMLSRVHGSMFSDRYDRSDDRLALSLKAANRALEIEPNSPEGRLALGMYYYTTMQFGLAMEWFESVRLKLPNNADLYGSIAGVQRRQGDFDGAIVNFTRAGMLEPTSPLRTFDIGLSYGLIRNYPEAERYMDKAITLAPDWPLPYIYKAWIYLFWVGDRDQARTVLAEASSKTDLSQTEYYRFYWWLSTILDDNPGQTLNRITPGSDTVSYYLYKSRVYDMMHDAPLRRAYCDSARIYLEPLAARQVEDPSIYSNLGLAYAGLGRSDDAVREGRKAVSMLPMSRDAFDGQFLMADLAEIYVLVGRHDDAIAALRLLLSNPGFTSRPYLLLDPIWAPLRDTPKFIKMLEEYD
jgi:TolB-like protein/Flp pilus assembly protein TadD/predicted Ser/Thr protein kinase